MEVPEKLLVNLIRHANVVYSCFEKPTTKVRENARLLKKDIEQIERRMKNDCRRSNKSP